MNIKKLLSSSVLIVALLMMTAIGLAQDTGAMTGDIEPINVVWDEAFNAGDVDLLMSYYSEDVISMPPGLPRREGADALRADFEFIFETYDAYHETEIIRMNVSNDVIVEVTEYLVRLDPVEGGEEIVETGTQVMIRERVDDEWLITSEIWNSNGASAE